jgi:small GTP-binding protein
VKIDTKVCQTDHDPVKLVIWDIAGSADLGPLQKSYAQGMSGYLLVCDGTRIPTLSSVKSIQATLAATRPDLPFCVLVNKSDLEDLTEVQESDIKQMRREGWMVMRTSAKSGNQVEAAFQYLAEQFNNANLGSV